VLATGAAAAVVCGAEARRCAAGAEGWRRTEAASPAPVVTDGAVASAVCSTGVLIVFIAGSGAATGAAGATSGATAAGAGATVGAGGATIAGALCASGVSAA